MLLDTVKKSLINLFTLKDVPFKVLILDEYTRDILSTIFKVSDLRDLGIISHYLIKNKRYPVDIPAIYFLKNPVFDTNEILLYSSYYIFNNFQFLRSEIEDFAVNIGQAQEANKIIQIKDTFLDFVCLQDDLFTFCMKNSYLAQNTREIANKLFCVFYTLQKKPFLVSTQFNDDVKSIFNLLEKKINNKLIKNNIKKPLLILLDRDLDLVTPCLHSTDYLSLINDLFNIKLNKINLEGKTVDLEAQSSFFKENRFKDFPTVVEIVENKVHQYKKELAISGNNKLKMSQEILDKSQDLMLKNEIINSNLNICMKILEIVKNRKIDDFYYMERFFNKEEILELSEKGEDRDIIRLCISLINTENYDLIEPILKKRNIKTKIINFIKNKIGEENESSFAKKIFKNLFQNKNIPLINLVEDILSKIKSKSLEEFYECSKSSVFYDEISEIFVFINRGTCYSELKELKELEKKIKIPIILGGTEIFNSDELLTQIEREINN